MSASDFGSLGLAPWLAAACREINSFNAVQEIVAALNSASVYRLKLTWGQLKGKTEELWRRTQESLSKEANWKKFREVLAQCDPPCIPYLGVYLTDLTFIEDGNKDEVEVAEAASNVPLHDELERLVAHDVALVRCAAWEALRDASLEAPSLSAAAVARGLHRTALLRGCR